MYRRHSKNSKRTKIKNMRKHTQKKNEIIEALNKCQTETETTTKREINELR
jgi:hypothetical protein